MNVSFFSFQFIRSFLYNKKKKNWKTLMASYHLSRPIFFTFAVDEKYNQFNRTNYQIPRRCTMC